MSIGRPSGSSSLRGSAPARRHAWMLAACLCAACTESREPLRLDSSAARGDCRARIIVGFAAEPDDAVLAALAQHAGAKLDVAQRLLPTQYVLNLRADGDEPNCRAAIERLRTDTRVRYVNLDERRAPNGQ